MADVAEVVTGSTFMGDLLPELLVLAVGGSLAPPLLLLTILFLGSSRPLPNAASLALGYFSTCAAIGVAGLALFGGAGAAVSMVGRVLSVTVGALLLIVGIRSLLRTPDPDRKPPWWTESVSAISSATAFGLGMALFPLQIKNLAIFVACVNLISISGLSPQGDIVTLGLVLIIFAVPVLTLIGLYATVPQRASHMLGSLQAWMERYNRKITVALCFVFGAFFLARGAPAKPIPTNVAGEVIPLAAFYCRRACTVGRQGRRAFALHPWLGHILRPWSLWWLVSRGWLAPSSARLEGTVTTRCSIPRKSCSRSPVTKANASQEVEQ